MASLERSDSFEMVNPMASLSASKSRSASSQSREGVKELSSAWLTSPPFPQSSDNPAPSLPSSSHQGSPRTKLRWSRAWMNLCLFVQFIIFVLGIFGCLYPYEPRWAMTAQVLFTLGALIALALAMSDPMTERPKELFVSLFFCLSMPLLEAMGNFVRKGTVGAMSAIVYAVYVAFMGAVAYGVSSKRALIQRKGPAFLEKFVIKQVPLFLVSSIVTLTSISANSFGCITSEDYENCWDQIRSNHSLGLVVTTAFFVRTFQVPLMDDLVDGEEDASRDGRAPATRGTSAADDKAERGGATEATSGSASGAVPKSLLEKMVTFDFAVRVQLQFIFMFFALVPAVYLFSTSSRSFSPQNDEGSTNILRVFLRNLVYFMCSSIMFISFVPSRWIAWLRCVKRLSEAVKESSQSHAASPLYRYGLMFISVILVFPSLIYVYVAFYELHFLREKASRSVSYTLPLLLFVASTYFAARTRRIGITDYLVYLSVPLAIFLNACAAALAKNSFLQFLWEMSIVIAVMVFVKVKVMTKEFLIFQSDPTANGHLERVCKSVVGAAIPLFFVVSQSVGCVLSSGDSWKCPKSNSTSLSLSSDLEADESCGLFVCDDYGTANKIVSYHIVFSYMYVCMYGFTQASLTNGEVASLSGKALKPSVIIEIFVFYALMLVAFFTFGSGASYSDALSKVAGLKVTRFVCFMWGIMFLVHGVYVAFEKNRQETVAGRTIALLSNAKLSTQNSGSDMSPSSAALEQEDYHVSTSNKAKFKKLVKAAHRSSTIETTKKHLALAEVKSTSTSKPAFRSASSSLEQISTGVRTLDETTIVGSLLSRLDVFLVEKCGPYISSSDEDGNWSELSPLYRLTTGVACLVPGATLLAYGLTNEPVLAYIFLEMRIPLVFLTLVFVYSSLKTTVDFNCPKAAAKVRVPLLDVLAILNLVAMQAAGFALSRLHALRDAVQEAGYDALIILEDVSLVLMACVYGILVVASKRELVAACGERQAVFERLAREKDAERKSDLSGFDEGSAGMLAQLKIRLLIRKAALEQELGKMREKGPSKKRETECMVDIAEVDSLLALYDASNHAAFAKKDAIAHNQRIRSIKMQVPQEKRDLLTTVLFKGIMGLTPAMVYLFSNSASCLARAEITAEHADFDNACASMHPGCRAMMLHITFALTQRLVVLPLLVISKDLRRAAAKSAAPTKKEGGWKLEDIVRLDMSVKRKMFLGCVVMLTCAVIWLFNTRDAGAFHMSSEVTLLFFVVTVSVGFLFQAVQVLGRVRTEKQLWIKAGTPTETLNFRKGRKASSSRTVGHMQRVEDDDDDDDDDDFSPSFSSP